MKFHSCLLLASALTTWGCVQHTEFKTSSGGRGYHIVCGNKYERCESLANKLCPDGFDRVGSKRRSKLDTPQLMFKADSEYELIIECDD